jgi:hypothetical protein
VSDTGQRWTLRAKFISELNLVLDRWQKSVLPFLSVIPAELVEKISNAIEQVLFSTNIDDADCNSSSVLMGYQANEFVLALAQGTIGSIKEFSNAALLPLGKKFVDKLWNKVVEEQGIIEFENYPFDENVSFLASDLEILVNHARKIGLALKSTLEQINL